MAEDSKTIKLIGRACDSNLLVHDGNDDAKHDLSGHHQHQEHGVLHQHNTASAHHYA